MLTPPPSPAVRRAHPRDITALCEIFGEINELHQAHAPQRFQHSSGPARDHDWLVEQMADDACRFWVAEIDGRIGGLLISYLRQPPPLPMFVQETWLTIDTVAVRTNCHRCGIGRALMAAAERFAAEQEVRYMDLKVYEFNTGAIRFYESLGYSTESRIMHKAVGNK